jgi:hypothetical protein
MAQRHMPFGYKIIDGAVAIEPEKADMVRKMFNDLIWGISLNQMAKALTEMKVPNANGKPSWNHGSIGKILSNCKYTGSDFYPAIITEEVFNAQQAQRRKEHPAWEEYQLLCQRHRQHLSLQWQVDMRGMRECFQKVHRTS